MIYLRGRQFIDYLGYTPPITEAQSCLQNHITWVILYAKMNYSIGMDCKLLVLPVTSTVVVPVCL